MASSENNLPGRNRMSAEEKDGEENSPIITSTSNQFSLLAEQYPDSTEDEDSKSSTDFTGGAAQGRQLVEDVEKDSSKGRQLDEDSRTDRQLDKDIAIGQQSEDVATNSTQGRLPSEDITIETDKGRQSQTREKDQSVTSSIHMPTKSKEESTSGPVSSTMETKLERSDTDRVLVSQSLNLDHSEKTATKLTGDVDIDRNHSQPFIHNVISPRPPIHSLVSSSESGASCPNKTTSPASESRAVSEGKQAVVHSEPSTNKQDSLSGNSQNVSLSPKNQISDSISPNLPPVSQTDKDPNIQSVEQVLHSSPSKIDTPTPVTRKENLTTNENVATSNQTENVSTSNLGESTPLTKTGTPEYVRPVTEEREISEIVNPTLDQSRQTVTESGTDNSNTDNNIINPPSVTNDQKASIVVHETRDTTPMETDEQVTSSSEEFKRDHKESRKLDDQANTTGEIESRKEEPREVDTAQIPAVSESKSCTNEKDPLLDSSTLKGKTDTVTSTDDVRAQEELSALGNQEPPKRQELSALDTKDSLEEEMEVDDGEGKTDVRDETTKIGEAELSESVSNFGPEVPEKQKELRAFKVDPEKKIIETEIVSEKEKKFTGPSVDSPASMDTSEDSQFSAEVGNSPGSVKLRTAVNIFRETAMDGEGETSNDLPTFDTPLGTPISMLASDTNDNPEETNLSLPSTDIGPTPAKRQRQTSMSSAVEELDQHIITVDRLYEYQWPQDGGEWHMLQEQVSEYLSVKSFKRKYPEMYRRFVDKEEKEFLMDRGVVTETLCDLGLTAIRSDEVFDLMYKDYPDKYQEYAAFMHGKQRQTIYEQHKEYDVPKLEKSKMADYMKKAVKSAVDFNQQLQRDRKEERRAFFDMQTFHIHYPEGRYKKLPANLTKPSAYPIALIPGQFQHYYTKYTPDELKYLPINTAMYDAPKRMVPAQKVISNTLSEMEDSQEEKTASSDGDSDGSSDSGTNSDGEDEKKKAEPVKETTCRRCEKKNKNKKRPRKVKEEIINCSECGAGGHPTCLELTSEMVDVIQTYPWQCMECKTCVECMDPYDEDKMMFCDRCDRGYHTFCVGVKGIPTGRWECKSCKVTTETPKSRRGNKN